MPSISSKKMSDSIKMIGAMIMVICTVLMSSSGQQSFSLSTPVQMLASGGVRGTRFLGNTVMFGVNSTASRVLNHRDRRQCAMSSDMRFPCQQRAKSSTRPQSVHQLRPGDIQVVAAIGDSLTAGTGALSKNFLQMFYEYRGVSFSIGGQGNWKTFLTLPNILKQFNPHLYGFSVGVSKVITSKPIKYNFAETGAETDMMLRQARRLIWSMKKDPHIDFYHDWKLVTLLVGHNDICSHACNTIHLFESEKDVSPKAYERNLRRALDLLHRELPKTFVNLLPISDLSLLFDLLEKPFGCVLSHAYGCPCLFEYKFTQRLSPRRLNLYLNAYLRVIKGLVYSGRYDTRDDFTVVIQPTLVKGDLPKYRPRPGARLQLNPDYLAPDCFHWAQKTHAMVARAMWNNMLEPVGHKTWHFRRNVPFLCPTDSFPYLATRVNSKKMRNGKGVTPHQEMDDDFWAMIAQMSPQQLRQCPL